MKTFIFGILFLGLASQANEVVLHTGGSFTLGDTTVSCQSATPPDVQCVEILASYCGNMPGMPSGVCFGLVAESYGCAIPGYVDCVTPLAAYCQNTGTSSVDCFTQSLKACKGSN